MPSDLLGNLPSREAVLLSGEADFRRFPLELTNKANSIGNRGLRHWVSSPFSSRINYRRIQLAPIICSLQPHPFNRLRLPLLGLCLNAARRRTASLCRPCPYTPRGMETVYSAGLPTKGASPATAVK
jgi:hypothetical protein